MELRWFERHDKEAGLKESIGLTNLGCLHHSSSQLLIFWCETKNVSTNKNPEW